MFVQSFVCRQLREHVSHSVFVSDIAICVLKRDVKLQPTNSHSVFVICCARLPDRLIVTFPNGDEIKAGDKKPAGSTIGEHCVIIAISQFSLIAC